MSEGQQSRYDAAMDFLVPSIITNEHDVDTSELSEADLTVLRALGR